jgi:CheY-like chemotaxis protein
LQLTLFTNPVDAIARFKNSPFSYLLVITDIRMPQMSGLELAKSILCVKPDAKIIIMTAFEINREELESSLPIIQHKDILKKAIEFVADLRRGKKADAGSHLTANFPA